MRSVWGPPFAKELDGDISSFDGMSIWIRDVSNGEIFPLHIPWCVLMKVRWFSTTHGMYEMTDDPWEYQEDYDEMLKGDSPSVVVPVREIEYPKSWV